MLHLLLNNAAVKNFWFSVIAWLESDHETIINLFLRDVLFGVTEIINDKFVNKVIIYAKMYIFNCKCTEKVLTLQEFVSLINKHL